MAKEFDPLRGQRITNTVVGAVIGSALAYVAWRVADTYLGGFLILALAYEGFTLVDRYPNNTISETMWRFAALPMVPWIFGVATGWAIQANYLLNPWLILAIGFLEGHFFWQAGKHEVEAMQNRAIESLERAVVALSERIAA